MPSDHQDWFHRNIRRRLRTGCWEWTGTLVKGGYGRFGHKLAHIWAYEHWVGPVPEGKEIDHTCRNRACVNPAHLEPVTHLENVRRGSRANQTHCKHGHEFTPENTRVEINKRGWRVRHCRACEARCQREYQQRKKAA